jgi:hypothetical protein
MYPYHFRRVLHVLRYRIRPDWRRRICALWHLPTAQYVLTREGHTGKVFSSVFSPDGTVLASGGGGANGSGEVFLWRAPA